ncbi:MAG TPA: CYTH domain-containing protein [Actinomycetota bacterium]|jgi:adenylate cyclase|nr:CYTH domain-containing protein [Actinomycetota bacterium]HNO14548.1 CYTH domain-containing protein [Actinomycetota bacterium]HUM85706.1 CYTH domain-containing protein [Actinomycetota bacterium]
MGVEIERKFLVVGDDWRSAVSSSTRIVQGYLASTPEVTVRVRVRGERAYLTIKGRSSGISRSEYEFDIPVADAEAMLTDLAQGPVIEKTRHLLEVDGHTWELDVFAGANEGLVMAEIELGSADEQFTVPSWAGRDVSDDARYYNVNLARTPYSHWA